MEGPGGRVEQWRASKDERARGKGRHTGSKHTKRGPFCVDGLNAGTEAIVDCKRDISIGEQTVHYGTATHRGVYKGPPIFRSSSMTGAAIEHIRSTPVFLVVTVMGGRESALNDGWRGSIIVAQPA
jgi:hypothetical protein